jgi:Cytochrome P450
MSQAIAPPPTSAFALPPGPMAPAWWQLVRFAGDPLGLLDECQRRYGDTFTLDVAGNGQFVMLSDPEAVREVFRGDPDVLHSGEANALFTATVGRHSVLVLDGAPHARQRRVLVPPLKGERMRSFFDAMRLETLEAAQSWPRDAPYPALPTMRRITLRVILRTALGLALGPEMDCFERKIETFLSHGRQRYALVLMTIVPIGRLSGSRWVPLFRQLSDLDDDLFALRPCGHSQWVVGSTLPGSSSARARTWSTGATSSTPSPPGSGRSDSWSGSSARMSGSRSVAATGSAWGCLSRYMR